MRSATIYFADYVAGILYETDEGYKFKYDSQYLNMELAQPISLTLPLRDEPYYDRVLFPFFDGLIPEGWLLDIAINNWKINNRDRFSLLLVCCNDCIGAVSVKAIEEDCDYE